jgi:hypothetical protein
MCQNSTKDERYQATAEKFNQKIVSPRALCSALDQSLGELIQACAKDQPISCQRSRMTNLARKLL